MSLPLLSLSLLKYISDKGFGLIEAYKIWIKNKEGG
jgi:hypothetical protein